MHLLIQFLLFLTFGLDFLLARLNFQTVQKDALFTGLTPYLQREISSNIKCHLLCQQTPDKCCYVGFKEQDNILTCSLYDFVGNINKHLTSSPRSQISAPRQNPQMDCLDWHRLGYTKDGVYYINFYGYRRKVFCDMTTDGGGWIVMQKRIDGSVDFNQDWETFKDGFGNVYTEYWLGNEIVHQYTTQQPTEALMEAFDFDNVRAAVKITNLAVKSETLKYEINFDVCSEVTHANLCVDWDYLKGMKFSSLDSDNDENSIQCAIKYVSGWWHKSCFYVNFNGVFYQNYQPLEMMAKGIVWHRFHAHATLTPLKSSKMLIRRKI